MISPQHFQQQAAHAAWSAESIAQMGLNHPWGVFEAVFDADMLKLGRLQAQHLHLRFQDGTLVDTAQADPLPPALALDGERQDAVVVLALPLLRANGGNCLKPDETAERPVRYRQRWRDVRNQYGDDDRQIAVMQAELTLRFAHQNNGDYLTCPVTRLLQDPQGNWVIDEAFLPPLFALLGELLEASLPSRVMAIALTHDKRLRQWQARLQEPRLHEGADYYLSVRSPLPAAQLQEQFPRQCKVGSPDYVTSLVNTSRQGIPLKPLSHVPAAIPLRLENQYFSLDLAHPAAQEMLASGSCMFYVPGTLGEPELELFAVLRT